MARKPNPYLIDDENPEWNAEDFANARPASEILPPELYAKLVSGQVSVVSDLEPAGTIQVRIALDQRIVTRFKSEGPGWQGRINDTLKKAVGL